MSLNRYQEPGWQRVGRIDKQERRSLWIRETYDESGPTLRRAGARDRKAPRGVLSVS